jgi:hypothetical protein
MRPELDYTGDFRETIVSLNQHPFWNLGVKPAVLDLASNLRATRLPAQWYLFILAIKS